MILNWPVRLTVLLLVLLGGACSKSQTPEQRIRAMLANAEQSAEKKDVRALRDDVSDQYLDADGRDRRMIDAALRVYVLRHQSIHLLTRIDSITFKRPEEANVVIFVAMAGRPIVDAAKLAAFQASLYRFDLGLVEEGSTWRVRRAAWRPADPSDFIR